MKIHTEIASGAGATAKGVLRTAGFFSLVVGFVPLLLLLRASGKVDPVRVPQIFHAILIRMMGFRVRVHGEMGVRTDAVLYVSNHSSYLDIPVLGSLIRGCFVAKSEVASWPLMGALARLQNTVFVERRPVRAGEQRGVLRDRLEQGDSLILFPEGTSSDGHRTLPFKSSLFSIVEKPLPDGRDVLIQPLSIVATEIGGMPMGRLWRPYYAWYGDMAFIKHLWEVFKIGSFTVDVVFHSPVSFRDFGNRKLLSDYCERAVSGGVDQCITGRFQKELAVSRPVLPKPPV